MDIERRQSVICSALAEHHRLLLLYAIAESPRSVGELVVQSGLSQPSVSRHLRILRESGIVSTRRAGRSVYYFPADARIVQAMELLRAVVLDQAQRPNAPGRPALDHPLM